jgi:hypothetical protein
VTMTCMDRSAPGRLAGRVGPCSRKAGQLDDERIAAWWAAAGRLERRLGERKY